MTLTVPLSVRIKTARQDRHITRDLRSLQFRSTVPGGYASATFSLDRPLTLQPEEFGYYANVYIQDGRNGSVVWEGRLEDQGRGAGSDGQVWELVAVGPAAHARDRKVPLIYVDSSMERWRRGWDSRPYAQVDEDELDDDETPVWLIKFPNGTTVTSVAPASRGYIVYRAVWECGQELSRVRARVADGSATSDWADYVITRTGTGGRNLVQSSNWNTSERFLIAEKSGTNPIPAGDNVAEFRNLKVSGGAFTTTNNHWTRFYDIVVRTVLKNASGADITSGYGNNYVLASEVVKDLLGRLLPMYDGAGAFVATTSHQIDQLAYVDGVTVADILDDLMLLEPAYYWTTGPSNAAGKYAFAWGQWPTTVRYEADVADGFDSPGSADGLYNACAVRWRNQWGFIKTTRRTSTVSELDAAGLIREEWLDLGDEVSSLANAQKVGDEFLAQHQFPPNAGTLTIARPIMDNQTGRMVQPWEINPGFLIRVRGVLPRVDSLNATARDGATVFKVVSVEYSADSAVATLELDSYAYSTARALADLAKRRTRRR